MQLIGCVSQLATSETAERIFTGDVPFPVPNQQQHIKQQSISNVSKCSSRNHFYTQLCQLIIMLPERQQSIEAASYIAVMIDLTHLT